MPSESSVGRMVRAISTWPTLNSPMRAALRDHEHGGNLIGHHQRGERIGDQRKAAGLHHRDAAHAAHIGAGQRADGFVLARGRQRR